MFNKCQKDNSGAKLWTARTRKGEKLGGGIVFDVARRMMTYFMTKQRRSNIPHVDRAPYSPQWSGEEGEGMAEEGGGSAQSFR